MMNQVLGFGANVAAGGSLATVDAVFAYRNIDYLAKAADFTGNANSKAGIFSGWFKIAGSSGVDQFILCSENRRVQVLRNSSNKFQILCPKSGGSTILDISSTTSYTYIPYSWVHLLASWDLATSTSHLYINSISNKTATTVTNDTIQYVDPDGWRVGAQGITFDNGFYGGQAEIYFAPGQYLDFSVQANREKFILTGKPVNLGADGSTPTGVAPIMYLKSTAASYGTNSGSGGNLTVTGAYSISTTSPSD